MPYKRPPNVNVNHHSYGRKHTEESKQKMRKKKSLETRLKMSQKRTEQHKANMSKAKLGELNPIWKGDKVGYNALHVWIKRHLPKPELCQRCNLVKPHDLANMTGKYTRDFENWQYLCRKCHMFSDNRIENLMKANKLYQEKIRLEIKNQNRICNVCKEGSDLWFNDIDGYICQRCYSLIRYYRIRPIRSVTN